MGGRGGHPTPSEVAAAKTAPESLPSGDPKAR
jgi:hypothetical protein